MRVCCLSLLLGLVVAPCAANRPEWRAGIARRDITPRDSIWMGGYASRNNPSQGVLQPLWAKALVLEDASGSRAAFVCMDLIGIGRDLVDAVARRVEKQTGLTRERLVLNCSHTHSGPVVAGVTNLVYDLTPEQQAVVNAYAQRLTDELVAVIETAVGDLRPVHLAFGEGLAMFGANRRAMRRKGADAQPDPSAPIDHSVPVLVVRDDQGSMRAVLFGYACHSTTLDIYEINGDYPGFAQATLENNYPAVTALFMAGCGADTNPHPRHEVELARQHGRSLAAAVDAVLGGVLQPVRGKLQMGFERVDLEFVGLPGKQQLKQLLEDKNIYQRRLAKHLLDELAAGRALPTSYACPVQVVRFGEDLLMVAMPGEPVVDYALRLRKEFAGKRVWVAGYCNEIFAYVPSERVLQEGGYEGGAAMVYFGFHGAFRPGLEQRLMDAVRRLAAQR